MRTFVTSGIASLTLAVLLATTPAWADDEPSAADIAAARALGQEGVKLAESGNCQEAIDRFSRSEKLFHAPTTLQRLGECQVQVGKLVDGTENLNRVVRENLPSNAPAPFVQAQDRAKKLLAEARPKIAKLKIAVAGPTDVTWVVKVDGDTVPLANLNTNRPMDPGEHTVEASAPGYKTARAKVTLAEAGSDSIALTLEPDPNAVKPEPAKPEPVKPEPAKSEALAPSPGAAETTNRVPAYVALGVGVVGVGVGTVFGLLASSKKSDLEDACTTNRQCPPSQQATIDDGKTFGNFSTVGFVVGGVALAVGAYLYLTSGPRKTSAALTVPGRYLSVDRVGLRF